MANYNFRLELNCTTYPKGEELYRYDVFEPYLENYPDAYDRFMDDNYEGEHISAADNMNIDDFPYYEGKLNTNAQTLLDEQYEEGGFTENIDELGAFKTLHDLKDAVLEDAKERFS